VAAQVAGEAGRDVVQLEVGPVEVDVAEELLEPFLSSPATTPSM
jgi:hypothetical protein